MALVLSHRQFYPGLRGRHMGTPLALERVWAGAGGERGQFVGHPGFHLQMQVMPWHNFLGLAHLPEVNTVMGATHSTVCARRFRVTPRGALAGDTQHVRVMVRTSSSEAGASRGGTMGREECPSVGGREAGAWGTDSPALDRRGDGAGGTAEGSRRVSL